MIKLTLCTRKKGLNFVEMKWHLILHEMTNFMYCKTDVQKVENIGDIRACCHLHLKKDNQSFNV